MKQAAFLQELEEILRSHGERYPLMQPTDAVKLIYQNEFGGGHLVRDEAAFRAYLQKEYEATEKNPAAVKYEALGNGIQRVYLAALEEAELDGLAEAFLRSAATHKGTICSFREKLALLRKLTEEGIFAFSLNELDAYLKDYEQAGFPMVSHSTLYRAAYAPAYRIVKK